MKKTPEFTPQLLRNKLGKIFESHKNISLAYLFGSQASGKTGPMSDIDIAILWKENEKTFLIKTVELGNKIENALNCEKVQVASLNNQGLSFCYNVIKTGICIYGTEEVRVRYETSILNQYLDFQYFARQYNKSFSERILARDK